jgi:16S rRNA (uracil1498-N3)-methyltransferase
MRQLVLPTDWDGGPECLLPPREGRHILRVLRLGPGDSLPAVDAAGVPHSCEILSVDGGALRIAVGPARVVAPALPDLRGRGRVAAGEREGSGGPPVPVLRARGLPHIVLAAAILKGDRFDQVIRQATEAGASRIIPLVTERSLGSEGGEARLQRRERLVKEALQQSGSAVPTRIDAPSVLRELPGRLGRPSGRRLSLLLHEAPLVEDGLHR